MQLTHAHTQCDCVCRWRFGCSPWAGPGVCRNDCPAAEAAAVSAAARCQQRSWRDPFGIIARAFALPSPTSHDDGLRVWKEGGGTKQHNEIENKTENVQHSDKHRTEHRSLLYTHTNCSRDRHPFISRARTRIRMCENLHDHVAKMKGHNYLRRRCRRRARCGVPGRRRAEGAVGAAAGCCCRRSRNCRTPPAD